MSAVYPLSVCARVREQVSLELDDELSQLERRMLTAHLERCAACATYADDVRDLTERMRSAPLHTMRRPVVVRRQRSITIRSRRARSRHSARCNPRITGILCPV